MSFARAPPGATAPGGDGRVVRSLYFGSLNAQRLPPCVMLAWLFATSPPQSGTAPPHPETTATHCSPSCSQVMGEPVIPDPVLYFHSSLPVFASNAFRKPSGVPVKTRLPWVESTPPQSTPLLCAS